MDTQNLNSNNETSQKSDMLKFRPATFLKNIKANPQKIKKPALLTGIAIVAAMALFFYKGSLVAAVVNGKPILRSQVVGELERRGGEATLDGLVNKVLLEQEAAMRGIKVTEEEINTDIGEIEKNMATQGTTLDAELDVQNLTREEFVVLLRTNKLLEKLIADKVAVTDEEVNQYIEQNKTLFPEGGDEAAKKEQVKNFLQQGKVELQSQELFKELRAKSKLHFWADYYKQ